MSHFIVGLTGGIGSGKTTIANMFADLGVELVDADIIARDVVAPNTAALQKISSHFGQQYIHTDGSLNRAKLREKVFSDQTAKKWLNDLLHPLIRQKILSELKQARGSYCILVAPLLLENNLTDYVNRVLVIDVDEKTQIARTTTRDNNSREQVQNIINSQIPRTKRLAAADDIIDNNGTDLRQINDKIVELHQHYLQLSKIKAK